MIDIFQFWSRIGLNEHVHPADRDVFDRLGESGHGFERRALPAAFMGPLRSARVVLLFMSPGLGADDVARAALSDEQNRYVRTRAGNEPLPDRDIPGGIWWRTRTKCFATGDDVASRNIAILNIGAYHSKEMSDPELLAALPSSRVSLEWAQSVLFPEAVAGKRIVVCLRSAKFWGLRRGRHHPLTLYAPLVTRAGHMQKTDMQQRIIAEVQRALSCAN